MAKRFLNSTENTLVSMVKSVMKRHKPLGPGFRRSFVNFTRSISVGQKPEDAHSLSVLVTEDLIVEVVGKFDSADLSSSFMNVMALADEELIAHYERKNRAPLFAQMLQDLLEAINDGNLQKPEWDVATFAQFVSKYLVDHSIKVSNKHLNQALQILMSPKHYRLLTVNWLLMRFIAAGYVEVARGARNVAQGYMKSRNAENEESALLCSASAFHPNSAVHSDGGLLFPLPDYEVLDDMLELETEAMANLYGLVLLNPYVDEEFQIAQTSFNKTHYVISKILSTCSRLLAIVGSASLAFYTGSMIASILNSLSSSQSVPNSQVDTEQLVASISAGVVKMVQQTIVPIIKTAIGGSVVSSTTAATTTPETLSQIFEKNDTTDPFGFTNLAALPASISLLVVIYLDIPILMFGGFAVQWIASKIRSRVDPSRFQRPSILTPLSCYLGTRLVMNTLLTLTSHISHQRYSTAVAWTVTRLYLPTSLIGQPSKITEFMNTAMAASPTNRYKNIPFQAWYGIGAFLISLPLEYLSHVLNNWGQVTGSAASFGMSIFGKIFSTLLKSARIAGLIAPVLLARKRNRDNYAYSSHFEVMFWTDMIRAGTSPPLLIAFDWAAGSVTRTTLVFTVDSLITAIPNMVCSLKYSTLSKTAAKLTALNAWLEGNSISAQQVVKLSTMIALEDNPNVASESVINLLEQHFQKDIPQDLGMDLIIDEEEQDDELDTELPFTGIKPNKSTRRAQNTAQKLREKSDERISSSKDEQDEVDDAHTIRTKPHVRGAQRVKRTPIQHEEEIFSASEDELGGDELRLTTRSRRGGIRETHHGKHRVSRNGKTFRDSRSVMSHGREDATDVLLTSSARRAFARDGIFLSSNGNIVDCLSKATTKASRLVGFRNYGVNKQVVDNNSSMEVELQEIEPIRDANHVVIDIDTARDTELAGNYQDVPQTKIFSANNFSGRRVYTGPIDDVSSNDEGHCSSQQVPLAVRAMRSKKNKMFLSASGRIPTVCGNIFMSSSGRSVGIGHQEVYESNSSLNASIDDTVQASPVYRCSTLRNDRRIAESSSPVLKFIPDSDTKSALPLRHSGDYSDVDLSDDDNTSLDSVNDYSAHDVVESSAQPATLLKNVAFAHDRQNASRR